MKPNRTFTTLPFPKIRKYLGKYVFTKTNTMDNELYEQYTSDEFKPTNLSEYYYYMMLRAEDPENALPLEVPASMLIDMVTNKTIETVQDKSKGIFFRDYIPANAVHVIEKEINASTDIFTMSEETSKQFSTFLSSSLVLSKDKELVTFDSIYRQASEIISNLKERPSEMVKIYSGGPGCGKTYQCIADIHAKEYKKVLVVSLSNIVGLRFLKRMKIKDSEQWSFTKTSLVRFSALDKFDAIVVEEASMISSNEFSAILKVVNSEKPLYFLGDPYQLPGFTGLGNLFATLLKEFPAQTITLTKQHRMNQELINVSNAVKTYGRLPSATNSTDPFGTYLEWVHNGEDAMAVTYTNEYCVEINAAVLQSFGFEKLYTATQSGELDLNSWREVLDEARDKDFKLKVISIKNLSVRTVSEDSESKFIRVLSNGEQGILTICGDTYTFTSIESGLSREYTLNDILYNFRLGYALTIHKAQGSEWENVYYYESPISNPNNFPLNLRYVAVTRAKSKLIWESEINKTLKFLSFNHLLTNKG